MPPGETTLSYLWTVPDVAVETDDGWDYRLLVQKQPGARSEPRSVRIDLPDGATAVELPGGGAAQGRRARHAARSRWTRTVAASWSLRTRVSLSPGVAVVGGHHAGFQQGLDGAGVGPVALVVAA